MLKQLLKNYYSPNKDFILKSKIQSLDYLSYMQTIDLSKSLPEQLMMKVDKITMFHHLESRAPYLDPKIVEFALSLPQNYKVKGFTGKYLLKKVAQKYLLKEIVWRQKHGFNVPLDFWFRNELKDIVYDSVKTIKNK